MTQTLLCKSYQTLSYFTLTCSMNSKVIIIIINNNQIKIYIKKRSNWEVRHAHQFYVLIVLDITIEHN